MLKFKNLFSISIVLFVLSSVSTNSFSQTKLSPEEINELRTKTYHFCASQYQNKSSDEKEVNNQIINCMSKNGFLTKEEYEARKANIDSQKTELTKILKQRLEFTNQCKKLGNNEAIIQCIKS